MRNILYCTPELGKSYLEYVIDTAGEVGFFKIVRLSFLV
jgi:hypothetical protein